MQLVKCEFCNVENDEKCVFAIVKRVIDGKENYFCSEKHAEAYVKQRTTQ